MPAVRTRVKKAEDPWWTIPAFLRRERTEESRRRADAVVRETLDPSSRQWIMPDRSGTDPEGASYMAKKFKEAAETGEQEIKTQDPALPVKMQFTIERGQPVIKDFSDLEQFLAWFNPEVHIVTGSAADPSITFITVKERPTPGKKGKLAAGDPAMAGKNAVEGAIPETSRGAVVKDGRGGARPGAVRHGCRVNGGTVYGSVYKAFLELGLSIPAHTKFRSELKADPGGKLAYEEKGKKYEFELVAEPK